MAKPAKTKIKMKQQLLKWIDYIFNIDYQTNMSLELFESSFDKFTSFIDELLEKDQCILVQFKIECTDPLLDNTEKMYRTIGYMQRIKKGDYKVLKDVLLAYWDKKSSLYNDLLISKIIFVYKLLPQGILDKTGREITTNIFYDQDIKDVKEFYFGGFVFPKTMDLTKWGICDFNEDYSYAEISEFKKVDSLSTNPGIYRVHINSDHTEVEFSITNNEGVHSIIKFKDYNI